MSYYVAPCNHLSSSTGEAADTDLEVPVTSDQVTQTEGPNDQISPDYASMFFGQESQIPLNFQNSLNDFMLKRQYEADDENDNVI